MIKHPLDRADRLKLKRKYSFKHSRRKGLTDETNNDRRIDETPIEEKSGVRTDTDQQGTSEERSSGIPGASPDVSA